MSGKAALFEAIGRDFRGFAALSRLTGLTKTPPDDSRKR